MSDFSHEIRLIHKPVIQHKRLLVPAKMKGKRLDLPFSQKQTNKQRGNIHETGVLTHEAPGDQGL